MNLIELRDEVLEIIDSVYEDSRIPEDIKVWVQIELPTGASEYSGEISIKYDNDSQVSGCVIYAYSK